MGVPARDAAGGGKGRPATLDQDVDAGFAGRRAGTPAPLLNFPFTRLPCPAGKGRGRWGARTELDKRPHEVMVATLGSQGSVGQGQGRRHVLSRRQQRRPDAWRHRHDRRGGDRLLLDKNTVIASRRRSNPSLRRSMDGWLSRDAPRNDGACYRRCAVADERRAAVPTASATLAKPSRASSAASSSLIRATSPGP